MSNEVYIDEVFVGYVDNPKDFVEKVKEKRREGSIPSFINIFYDDTTNTVRIFTHKGRIQRPLIVVKNGKPLLTEDHIKKLKNGELTWADLEKNGIIEWVDSGEEENTYVALRHEDVTKEHTHMELSPLVIFGILTSLVPWSNHNQSTRLNRGMRTQKQSHAIYTLNFWTRFDSDISVAFYPQEPLVRTFSHNLFKHEDAIGQNVVVAVMSQEGYSMEDAIIMNKASIDRGLYRSMFLRPYEISELKYPGGLQDEIKIPEQDVMHYKGKYRYRHLEDDGIIYPEAEVEGGDVLVGRVSPPRFIGITSETFATGLMKKDTSLTMRSEEKGVVDTVIITESGSGHRLIRLRVRDLRIPELGDKFSVRHGQKGVIGMIVDPSDMPWTASGIVPDVLFSPYGIPSRMTAGYILEVLAGKVGSLSGRYIDGTPWMGEKEDDLRRELLRLGFREDGTETMYNPLTGEEFKVKIFVGSMYYLRLKYMAANKLHARARGPVALLTRQPTEGKAREGGLRYGEMENQVLAAHGTSLLLRETFSSDDAIVYVCDRCGAMAIEDDIRNRVYCPICEESEKISKIKTSYAFKLFLQELISLGVWPKIKTRFKFEK